MTYPDNKKVHDAIINLSSLEHPLWTDSPPDERGIVYHLGAIACEALGVGRLAKVGDIPVHPSENWMTEISFMIQGDQGYP